MTTVRQFPALALSLLLFASRVSRADTTLPPDGAAVEVTVQMEVQTGPVLSLPPPLPVPVLPGSKVRLAVHGLAANEIRDVSWAKNSVNLDVHGSELALERVGTSDTGQYLATVTTTAGDVILSSRVLHVAAFLRQRLLNLSTRAAVTAEGSIVIAGFVVDPGPGDPGSAKSLLIRAVGPSLQDYGVANALADPTLRLFRGDGSMIEVGPGVRDPDRVAEAVRLTGAAPLRGGGADVAWVISLRGGVYTAQVSSADHRSGEVLVEIYEVPR